MTRVVITAPSSGAGKTTVTLALLRLLKRQGLDVQPAKSGPDYIDPQFHKVAAGRSSINLDAWAMPPDRILGLASDTDCLVAEAAMGFFDGAGLQGHGSAFHLAKTLDAEFILVVDAAKMAHSVAALVQGYITAAAPLQCRGIILNRVGSPRHEMMLHHALRDISPVLATLPRDPAFQLPERHLGLVQAHEHSDLDAWIDTVADRLAESLDISAFQPSTPITAPKQNYTPPGQRIAVARDVAFAFAYPHMLNAWRDAGAEIIPFSPLANDRVPAADFIYLPGGYPELHAGKLAAAGIFLTSLKQAAENTPVYGECGGYMTLGDGLIDADGHRHQMAGLLRLETSFAKRKLHLGYRRLTPLQNRFPGPLKGHEFHYASTISAKGDALFAAQDADGQKLPDMGLQSGRVFGSFAHIIDGF